MCLSYEKKSFPEAFQQTSFQVSLARIVLYACAYANT